MISSIQASNLFGTSSMTFQNVSVSTSSSAAAAAQEEEKQNVTTSADGDTLEISAASTNLVQKTYTGSSMNTGLTEDEGYSSSVAQMVSSAASSVGINEYTSTVNENSASSAAVSESSSSSGSSSSLSQYTEAELKEMLENGEITQAEYNEEISSRQTESGDEEESEAGIQGETENEASEG